MSVRAQTLRLEACRPASPCGLGALRVHALDTGAAMPGTVQQRRQHARGRARGAAK